MAGIQWQKESKNKQLADLLANQHVVKPLLKFLEDIVVGCGKTAAEKTAEQGKKRGQDREDQLRDFYLPYNVVTKETGMLEG